MLNIDPRSIVLMANLISIFCLIVLLIMGRSFPPSIGGLREWTWACAMAILASVLIFARGMISPLLSIVLANTLVAAVFLAMHASIRRFSGLAVNYRAKAAILAVLACLWAWAAYGSDYPRYGIQLSSLSNTLLMGACAHAVSQNSQRSTAKWFSQTVFAAATLMMALRFVSALMGQGLPTHVFDASPVHKVYIATYPLTFLAATFGFMLMASDKLRDLLLGMNRTLEDAVAKRTAALEQEIQRARELEREVASIADSERRRIGRELHDDLGQQLAGISLAARAVAEALKSRVPDLAGLAGSLDGAASEAIAKVRRMAHGLMPVGPGSDGLREALTRLAASVTSMSHVVCTFDYDDPVDVDDENVATHLFRIAQEAVNNAVRHSRASHLLLRLDDLDGKVSLSISDNGIGLDRPVSASGSVEGSAQGSRGVGVRLMAFRASVIRFLFAVESQPGQGTTVRVTQC